MGYHSLNRESRRQERSVCWERKRSGGTLKRALVTDILVTLKSHQFIILLRAEMEDVQLVQSKCFISVLVDGSFQNLQKDTMTAGRVSPAPARPVAGPVCSEPRLHPIMTAAGPTASGSLCSG